jgi:heterotetrameric sarcosine oxidase gamma subunit
VSLAFLTPDVTVSRDVQARSPMERPAVDAGARLSRVDGWSVANAYSEPSIEWERLTRTVAFADRSSLTKLELQAEPRELAWIVAPASDNRGLKLEPGLAEHVNGTWWCPVTPSRVLMLGAPGEAPALRATLEQAAEEARGTVTVLDVTCGLAAMSLIGPGARELLARFCAIDVRPALAPPGAFRPGSVARTPGYVLVEAEDRLLVLVGWALGEYLWQVVADAAAQLGGGPVGAEALAHYLERDDA